MELEELCLSIFENVCEVLNKDIASVELDYSRGDYISTFGIYYVNDLGVKEMVSPADYTLEQNEIEILDKVIDAGNLDDKQCNSILLTIKSWGSYILVASWDEELHQDNEGYKESILEEQSKRIKKSKVSKQTVTFDRERFDLNDAYACDQRVLSFESLPEITGSFYAHLYSFFREQPEIMYEGFMYSITNKESNVSFCAGCSASGIGYYAKDEDPVTLTMIHEFHEMLFSSENVLVDCSMSFEHDYGATEIGFADDQIFEIDTE